MPRYQRLAGAVIIAALAAVTLYKLFQEPVSQPLIVLVIAVIVSALVLLGIRFKSIKYKDIEVEFDKEAGKRLDDVTVSNPFGEREILLNGRAIQVVEPDLASLDTDDFLVHKRHGFALARPATGGELTSGFMAMGEYVKSFESTQGTELLLQMPIIGQSRLFRVAHADPVRIEFVDESYAGDYVSESTLTSVARRYKREENAAEMQRFAKRTMFSYAFKHYNELTVMVCPRRVVEDSLLLDTLGRKADLTPLNFVLRFGGVPPKLETLDVKHASVSHDGRVWGFYGETRFHDVLLDGAPQTTVHFDFYKIFLMNEKFVYQIGLHFIPVSKHPRSTWDELVRLLQSVRVVV